MANDRANDRARDQPEQKASEQPSAAPDAGAALAPGSQFARYAIVRCVGVGGMGAVFEATHTLLRKRVALKTLHANLGKSESARERFLREAETVARIQHPNVVDITDVGIENNIPYFVMEYLEGEDLASWLDRGALSSADAVDIVIPIASGLSAVHRLGIVHRDIKPENVFLARGMRPDVVTPKLVDFGVSKDILASLGDGGPPLHTVTGTPHYMSPEQARGSASLDSRTDQYALSVLLYQCLTGARPYDAGSLLELMHLIDTGEFRPLRSLTAHVDEGLERVVHRAMSRNPRDRFATTEAFGEALLPFASERVRMAYGRDFEIKSEPWPTAPSPKKQAQLEAATMPMKEPPFSDASSVEGGIESRVRVRQEAATLETAPAVKPGTPQRLSRPSFSSLTEAATSKEQRTRLVVFGGIVMALLMLGLGLFFGFPALTGKGPKASKEPVREPPSASPAPSTDNAEAAPRDRLERDSPEALPLAAPDGLSAESEASDPPVPETPLDRLRVAKKPRATKSVEGPSEAERAPAVDIQLSR